MSTLKAGKYKARAMSWALSESSKGTPQVAVSFEILSPGSEGENIGWYGYLSDAAYVRTVESLRHMGWQGDDLTQLEGLDANEVELVLDTEEYEGKQHLRVKWVNKPGLAAEPMAPDKLKAFAAQMQKKIRALDAQSERTKKPAASTRPSPPPPTDSEIPF